MIAGISKLITLHLAPVLSLVSLILLYIAYFAPVTSLHTEVSLVSLTPAITLVALNARSHSMDEQDLRVLFNGRVVPRGLIAERALASRASRPAPVLELRTLRRRIALENPSPPSMNDSPLLQQELSNLLATRLQSAYRMVGCSRAHDGALHRDRIAHLDGKAVEDFNQDIIDMGKGVLSWLLTSRMVMWIAFSFAAPSIICALFQVQFAAAAGKA
ncbi:hypothetical protein RHS01_04355 [Rhizoctonia solani]|uniref:Uncharacterized protein n=1 Tax=Rhizoctonia solani TaxID=456999 RepID=A0A8H7IH94_9AGAM|nr:hypothetical protein RHS01_04355 [Rhizoctonia solani]